MVRALCVAAVSAVLAGCGPQIAIEHPGKPIYAVTDCTTTLLPGRVKPRPTDGSTTSKLLYFSCPGRFDARALLGLTLIDAERVAAAHHAWVREVTRNGKPPEVPTADKASNRVDVATEDGIVTKIEYVG